MNNVVKLGIRMAVVGGFLGMGATPVQALDIGAMGNVDFTASNQQNYANSFSLGAFDIYGNQQIDTKTRVFFEFVLEDGGSGMGVDLERMFISRKFSSAFELSAGRYHTPLGYWNKTYHHGAIMSDTVDRPSFLEFEDASTAILPMHIIGLSAEGSVTGGAGKLGYQLAMGNSSSLDSTKPTNGRSELGLPNVSDNADKKAALIRVVYQPEGVPMHFAVFGMNESYAEAATAGGYLAQGSTLVAQRVAGFDTRYATDKFDVTAEYFNIRNGAQNGVGDGLTHTGKAYYVQVGYKVVDNWKVVYRRESVDFDAADEYFKLLGTEKGHKDVAGIRYDLDDSNALKFEIKRNTPDSSLNRQSDTTYMLQWAFMAL